MKSGNDCTIGQHHDSQMPATNALHRVSPVSFKRMALQLNGSFKHLSLLRRALTDAGIGVCLVHGTHVVALAIYDRTDVNANNAGSACIPGRRRNSL